MAQNDLLSLGCDTFHISTPGLGAVVPGGLEQGCRVDLGCGRGQGKKQQSNGIHGITHLQNPRSRREQRRQGDTEPCRCTGNSWCSLRALGADVDPLRCRKIAARASYRTCFPWEGSWGLAWSRFRRKQCKNSGQHLRWSFWRGVINTDTITKLFVSKEKFSLLR